MRDEKIIQLYTDKLIKLIDKGLVTEDRIADAEIKKRVKAKKDK